MTEPLISVIVPIYKVEQYLRRCVDSILAQTYTNLEVILVDDGSPDGCGDICDEYAAREVRVVVIHKENGGLSDARNAGLDNAKGEYIGFVDSDDWIETSMYESLYITMINNGSDIAICGIRDMPSGMVHKFLENTESAVKTIDRIYIDNEINISVWNRLYKKELFNSIRFPKGKCFEDVVTTYKLFESASVVSSITVPLYNYLHRDNSISNSKLSLNVIDHIDQWHELLRIIPAANQELYSKCLQYILHVYLETLKYLFWQGKTGFSKENARVYNLILQYIDAEYTSFISQKNITLRHKLVLTAAKLRVYVPFKKLENI